MQNWWPYEMVSLLLWDKLKWANLVGETGWMILKGTGRHPRPQGKAVKETHQPEPWCGTAQRALQSCSHCPSRPRPSGCWHRCTAAGSRCCRSLWLRWSSSWTVLAAPPHQRLLRVLWEKKENQCVISGVQSPPITYWALRSRRGNSSHMSRTGLWSPSKLPLTFSTASQHTCDLGRGT